jgi:hypothetical protein
MTRIHRRHPYARAATASAVLALTAFLGACQTQSMGGAMEGIGFRQERFQEIAAMQTYRACVDDAVKLDTEARAQGNPGGYIASARLIEKCEAELGPEAATVAQEERMRAYALSASSTTSRPATCSPAAPTWRHSSGPSPGTICISPTALRSPTPWSS